MGRNRINGGVSILVEYKFTNFKVSNLKEGVFIGLFTKR
jgi:hypothetical protein